MACLGRQVWTATASQSCPSGQFPLATCLSCVTRPNRDFGCVRFYAHVSHCPEILRNEVAFGGGAGVRIRGFCRWCRLAFTVVAECCVENMSLRVQMTVSRRRFCEDFPEGVNHLSLTERNRVCVCVFFFKCSNTFFFSFYLLSAEVQSNHSVMPPCLKIILSAFATNVPFHTYRHLLYVHILIL